MAIKQNIKVVKAGGKIEQKAVESGEGVEQNIEYAESNDDIIQNTEEKKKEPSLSIEKGKVRATGALALFALLVLAILYFVYKVQPPNIQ